MYKNLLILLFSLSKHFVSTVFELNKTQCRIRFGKNGSPIMTKDVFLHFIKPRSANVALSLPSYPTRYKNGGSKFLYNFFTTVSRFFGRQRKGKSISTTSRGQKKFMYPSG